MALALLKQGKSQEKSGEKSEKSICDSFKEGIKITRDKIFRIIQPNVSMENKIIYKEEVKQIDEPMDNSEIMHLFPVGKEYIYTKATDNKNIKVTLLRYSDKYAIFSTGMRGLKVEISNLEKRLSKISDNVVFPDFFKSTTKQEENNHQKENVISFEEKKFLPERITKTFSKYSIISETEQKFLGKNKYQVLKNINNTLLLFQSNQVNDLSEKSLFLPVVDFKNCFLEIEGIKDSSIKKMALQLFQSQYIDFLKMRKDFILETLFIPENLDGLLGEDLFHMIDFYEDFSITQKIILTNKIKNDINFFIHSCKGTNDILIQLLKEYGKNSIFSKKDIENIYHLSQNK